MFSQSHGKISTLRALIWSLFPLFPQLHCYTPLYEKDTKQMQNKPMETTHATCKMCECTLPPYFNFDKPTISKGVLDFLSDKLIEDPNTNRDVVKKKPERKLGHYC